MDFTPHHTLVTLDPNSIRLSGKSKGKVAFSETRSLSGNDTFCHCEEQSDEAI